MSNWFIDFSICIQIIYSTGIKLGLGFIYDLEFGDRVRHHRFQWWEFEKQFLILLAKVRDEEEVSMGTYTDNAFYKNFATKLSANQNVAILDHDIADRVRHHRNIFKGYKVSFYQSKA